MYLSIISCKLRSKTAWVQAGTHWQGLMDFSHCLHMYNLHETRNTNQSDVLCIGLQIMMPKGLFPDSALTRKSALKQISCQHRITEYTFLHHDLHVYTDLQAHCWKQLPRQTHSLAGNSVCQQNDIIKHDINGVEIDALLFESFLSLWHHNYICIILHHSTLWQNSNKFCFKLAWIRIKVQFSTLVNRFRFVCTQSWWLDPTGRTRVSNCIVCKVIGSRHPTQTCMVADYPHVCNDCILSSSLLLFPFPEINHPETIPNKLMHQSVSHVRFTLAWCILFVILSSFLIGWFPIAGLQADKLTPWSSHAIFISKVIL